MPGPGSECTSPPRPGSASLSARRVLVVDDAPDSATSLALLLRLHGFETRTAFDGPSAVAVAEVFEPHAIVLDLDMPAMNGYEVARHVRSRPWSLRVAIVALTGWDREEDRHRSVEAGCNWHLVKPVEPALIISLLDGATPLA